MQSFLIFAKNLKAINYFREKGSIVVVPLGSKYTSDLLLLLFWAEHVKRRLPLHHLSVLFKFEWLYL